MFIGLFGSRRIELKAPLRVNHSISIFILNQSPDAVEAKGTSGTSFTELELKGVGTKTLAKGKKKTKGEDWRNLMNIPSGGERGTIYQHQGLPAENSAEKLFQKLQKSEGICRQTEYACRPVHERVREQAAYTL